MVLPTESARPSNIQSDRAFIKAVVQGLMDAGDGRVMELSEAKAKLGCNYSNADAKQSQETLAILKMLEQSRQAVSQGKTIFSVEAFAHLRQRGGLV